jgi:hypothetical protein
MKEQNKILLISKTAEEHRESNKLRDEIITILEDSPDEMAAVYPLLHMFESRMREFKSSLQPTIKEEKSVEDFFKERFFTENWDKHDRKIQRYDYYDMTDFAQQFKSKTTPISESKRIKELEEALRELIDANKKMAQWIVSHDKAGTVFTGMEAHAIAYERLLKS